jgi:hypothetical protein
MKKSGIENPGFGESNRDGGCHPDDVDHTQLSVTNIWGLRLVSL